MAIRMDRIEARIERGRAQKIREAAKLTHTSVSSFLVDAASKRADEVLARQNETTLESEFFDDLLKALDRPAKTIPALKKAVAGLSSRKQI